MKWSIRQDDSDALAEERLRRGAKGKEAFEGRVADAPLLTRGGNAVEQENKNDELGPLRLLL